MVIAGGGVIVDGVTASGRSLAEIDEVGTRAGRIAEPDAAGRPAQPASRSIPDLAVTSASVSSLASRAPVKVQIPTLLTIESLGVSARVVAVGVAPDGQMEIPERGDQIGWYRHGPAPGAAHGSAVLASHITTRTGWGVLAGLGELGRGDPIVVHTAAGEIHYTVRARAVVPKADLDTAELFARQGEHRLLIVTCGGPWVEAEGAHRDNVIVEAVLEQL